ncbi:MAG: carboxypeptidase-like regulatory domain-containing protein [Balneolaceae bacterium]|nr:carboxypeptidase-like regulatory domain-containing protein [Balneolaceae bacterium]
MTYILLLLFIQVGTVSSQSVEGHVIDKDTGQPLSYVNIGIMGTTAGTVSDENGNFILQYKNKLSQTRVRFSMIGYKSSVYTLEELEEQPVKIKLEPEVYNLDEVVVSKSALKKRRIGTSTSSKIMVTGWSNNIRGGERGIRIKVDEKPVFLKNLNVHVVNNGYEEVLMRVHFRKFIDDSAGEHIVGRDILFPIRKKSGWIGIDLEAYDLVFEEDVVVTLQPVQKKGTCKENNDYCLVISLNRFKPFSTSWFFAKTSSESNWIIKKNWSPGIYFTAYEE